MSNTTLGFLGAGKMATALIEGFIRGKNLNPSRIFAFDVNPQRLEFVSKKTGIQRAKSNKDVVRKCDNVVIAVTPEVVRPVLNTISSDIDTNKHMVLSIAAGLKLNTYEELLPKKTKIVRMMPNVNCEVGAQAAAICVNKVCTEQDYKAVQQLFASVGSCCVVDENIMVISIG